VVCGQQFESGFNPAGTFDPVVAKFGHYEFDIQGGSERALDAQLVECWSKWGD